MKAIIEVVSAFHCSVRQTGFNDDEVENRFTRYIVDSDVCKIIKLQFSLIF